MILTTGLEDLQKLSMTGVEKYGKNVQMNDFRKRATFFFRK